MNNDADATLQHYARGIYSILADILMTTFLFGGFLRILLSRVHKADHWSSGCLTVLSAIAAYHLMSVWPRQASLYHAFQLTSSWVQPPRH